MVSKRFVRAASRVSTSECDPPTARPNIVALWTKLKTAIASPSAGLRTCLFWTVTPSISDPASGVSVDSVAFGSVAVASLVRPAVPDRPSSPFLSFLDNFPVAQIMVPTLRESIRVDSTFGLLDRFWRMPAIAGGMEVSYEYTIRKELFIWP